MQNRNLTDIIEQYLKSVLAQSPEIEIKRSEIADKFACVPSQINYVINTRFTQHHGYSVESKRGGAGYIRIVKLQVAHGADQLSHYRALLATQMSLKSCLLILQSLYEHGLITKREGTLMASLLEKEPLEALGSADPAHARALLMHHFLEQLRYES